MLKNCGTYPRTVLTPSEKKNIEEDARKIASKYPKSSLNLNDTNPSTWAEEGFELASQVYNYKINKNDEAIIDKDYINRNYPTIEKQIAKGGYRLANEIEE